jgi:hypothetical protein
MPLKRQQRMALTVFLSALQDSGQFFADSMGTFRHKPSPCSSGSFSASRHLQYPQLPFPKRFSPDLQTVMNRAVFSGPDRFFGKHFFL